MKDSKSISRIDHARSRMSIPREETLIRSPPTSSIDLTEKNLTQDKEMEGLQADGMKNRHNAKLA